MPSLIIAAKMVPAMMDCPTMTCRQPVSWPCAFETRFELVKIHGPIQAAMDVVLAGPLQLDRRAVGAVRLGDRYRLDDVIGAGIGAPAEAAAGIQRVNADLLRIQTRGARSVHLIDGLELIAGPDLAAVGGELDHRIERLHRRVRKIGKFVAGRSLFGPHRGSPARHRPPCARQAPVDRRGAGTPPSNRRSCASPPSSRPSRSLSASRPCLAAQKLFATTATPRGTCTHLDHARHCAGGGRIEGSDRRAEQRRALEQRHQHAGHHDIQRKLRGTVALRRHVDARRPGGRSA